MTGAIDMFNRVPKELVASLYYDESSPTKLRWITSARGRRIDSVAGSKRRYYSARLIGWKRQQYMLSEVLTAVKARDKR